MKQLLVTFGLPGAGKTYVAKVLERHFQFYYYEGDRNLTSDMHEAIRNQIAFTDIQRQTFFSNLIQSISTLLPQHQKIVVAQTFIKEVYRKQFLEAFPHTQFLLITADEAVRRERLRRRIDMPLSSEYAAGMTKRFEMPRISHQIIVNTQEGEEAVKKQLILLTN